MLILFVAFLYQCSIIALLINKREKQMLQTLQQIQNHQFIGNFGSDSQAFQDIDTFALNTDNPLSERAEVLRIMTDKGMGCGRDEQMSDSEIVQDYLDNI